MNSVKKNVDKCKKKKTIFFYMEILEEGSFLSIYNLLIKIRQSVEKKDDKKLSIQKKDIENNLYAKNKFFFTLKTKFSC